MMLPARTRSPPNFLMPRYCAFESRPFRVDPTPFLCAIVSSQQFGLAERDVANADFGEALTVALLLSVVLATTELEDNDLVAKSVLHDFAGDLGALQHGHASLNGLA